MAIGGNVIRTEQVHGTVVALEGRGVLVFGPSGSGKSSLALELMATGALLVSDDRTDIRREGDRIIASPPDNLKGRIEARGAGILRAQHVAEAALVLTVDLGQVEDQRLPPKRHYELLGRALPLVLGPYRPHFYAVLRQLLLHGRAE